MSTRPRPEEIELEWQDVLAAGVVAGDVSAAGLVRFAGVSPDGAARAVRAASDAGVLVDGGVSDAGARELADRLPASDADRVHAAAALHLMTIGPDHFEQALEHARLATAVLQPDLVRMARSSGRLALAAGDHQTADLLLRAVLELDVDDDPDRAHLLFDLARAADGCGRVDEARDLLAETIRLAEVAGDRDLVVDAAIRSAFPPDWRAGDRRTAALLDLAERLEQTGPRAPAILAARAMVEMRVPAADEDHQFAWVTRAGVAQPLAERALELTAGSTTADRLVALAAWHTTHRSPAALPGRLAAARESVDLAQRLLDHDRLVDAAMALAVDALEAGDRGEYDQSLATVRWAAQTDGNPRLRWWASTASAGAALLDGDIDAAERHRSDADAIGRLHELPGWVAGEILLAAETALAVDDPEELRAFLLATTDPLLASPIARSTVALIASRLGEPERAAREVRIAFRALDEESSYLLCLTLLARTLVGLDEPELSGRVEELLRPWRGRFAVDASGWWCSGPVDLTLAQLASAAGRTDEAVSLLDAVEPIVRSVGDARAEAGVARLRSDLAATSADGPGASGRGVPGIELLSDREREVLVLIARGATNAAIGAELAFSPSTIRADTVSIYRKLGVNGRAEAAAVAVAAGLADRGI